MQAKNIILRDPSVGAALAAVLFWSTVATAFKIALRYHSPFMLLTLSVYTSTAVLAGILLIQGKAGLFRALKPMDLLQSALLGFLNPFIYYQLLFFAYDRLPAQTAQVINFTWPIVLVVLTWLLGYERLRWKQMAALTVSFFGTFVVVGGLNPEYFRTLDLMGAVLAFISSFVWAGYWILNRKRSLEPVLSLFLAFLSASLFISVQGMSGIGLGADGWFGEQTLSWSSLLPAVYVGIFEMSVTFAIWLTALRLAVNTAKVGNLIYLSPFLSLLFIAAILGESIRPETVAGLILIVGGILGQMFFSGEGAH